MDNTGTSNNLYMPYGIDDFTKKNIFTPNSNSRQPLLDDKLSSNQMHPGNALRYIPNPHHVPHVSSTSRHQVPHHFKEIQSYFLDSNGQVISASSVHNRPHPQKIPHFNGNPSLPKNPASLHSQYSHTFHDRQYIARSTPLNQNHMVVTSQTSASMSTMVENHHQKVKISPTEVTRNLPFPSSQQKKWDQSNTEQSRILQKEISVPVISPSQYSTSTKDQTLYLNPSLSSGYTADHAYSTVAKNWQVSYSKSNPVNYRQSATTSSSSYALFQQCEFQNAPTNELSRIPKISIPSTGPEQSLISRKITTSSCLNGCTSDTGTANTVQATLTKVNFSSSSAMSQSKVITSTACNRHKLPCDVMKNNGCLTQSNSSARKSSPTRGNNGKTPCQLWNKSRRRASSFDPTSPRLHVSMKRRRHSFSGRISALLCAPTTPTDKKKLNVQLDISMDLAPSSTNTGVSACMHLLKTEPAKSVTPASQHKLVMPTVACNRPNQVDTVLNDSSKQSVTKLTQELTGNTPIVDSCKPKPECPACSCVAVDTSDAPYYTHLGAAKNVAGIRTLFEKRMGYCGKAIRIEKVIYTGKEGKTSQGCPMAKTVIRRSGSEEKVLVVCRNRPGHYCPTATIVVIILIWDGLARPLADFAYYNIAKFVPKHGEPTERRCGTNDERTCACQGFDESTCGASFSFGCSWSMYYNGCKYARSHNPNKYKLVGTKDPEAEKFVGKICETLATAMSPLYEMAAPDAFNNQVEHEEEGYECRLGEEKKKKSRPFSGVTSCMDFCAHSHKDQHNMDNGSTVVVTFTKPELRHIGKNVDEQLHVLPLCKLDLTDEKGSLEGIHEKLSSGAIELMDRYHHQVRLRSTPKLSKKQKSRAKKKENGSAVSPPFKRKGRPPKRSTSYDNLFHTKHVKLQDSGEHFTFHKPRYSQELQMTSPVQLHSPIPSAINNHRGMTEQHNYAPMMPQNSYPGTMSQNHYNSIDNGTPNDNLPSIKRFFVGPEQGFQQQNAASFTNFQVDPDGQMPNTPPHIHPIKNMSSSPMMVPQPSANSPNAMKSFPGMMHNNASVDSEGYSTPSTPQSTYGDTMYSMPYGTSPNLSQGAAVPEETIQYSDSEDNFMDSEIGGVAVAPGHGSVLIECAKKELHATTALRSPNRFYPSRISLVFYQHKSMNCRNHGAAEYGAKEEERRKQREKKMETSQIAMDTSFQNSPNLPMGMQPYSVLDSIVRQYAGTPSGYQDQALKIVDERNSLPRQQHLPTNQITMSPMSWVQSMPFGCNGRFIPNSLIPNPTYANRPTMIPMPNSPQYPSQHSSAVPRHIGMESRHSHVQPMPGANHLPVNSCTPHMDRATRSQAPLQSGMSVITSQSPHHIPSMRLPFSSNEMVGQIPFGYNSTSSHADTGHTTQSMRYVENPNVGYNGRSTL